MTRGGSIVGDKTGPWLLQEDSLLALHSPELSCQRQTVPSCPASWNKIYFCSLHAGSSHYIISKGDKWEI